MCLLLYCFMHYIYRYWLHVNSVIWKCSNPNCFTRLILNINGDCAVILVFGMLKNINFQFTSLSRPKSKFVVFLKIWILKEINYILVWFTCGLKQLLFQIGNSRMFLNPNAHGGVDPPPRHFLLFVCRLIFKCRPCGCLTFPQIWF